MEGSEYLMKKIISWILIVSFIQLTTVSVWAQPQRTLEMFKDVSKNHWAYDAIFELKQDGILIGYPGQDNTKFNGERTLTRYEFALALAKSIKQIEKNIEDENKNFNIQEYLKNQKVSDKDIELLSMLIKEFKKELRALDVRVTKLEQKNKKKDSWSLYLSLAAFFVSLAALTITLQK